MANAYGPDKLGSHQSEAFSELVEKINEEIGQSYCNFVEIYLRKEESDKYKSKLKKLYNTAGWDCIDFDYEYDWEYETVKMTLRK